MTNSVVTVNVAVVAAPTPSTLQSTGAIISQGGTNTAAGTSTLITQPSDLTAILKGALAITSITWTTNVATVTTAANHGIPSTDQVEITISGATPSTYNGTFLATSTGVNTFTYPLLSNPGGSTSVPGVWTPEDVVELTSMVNTFFGQGTQQSVYVLETGDVDVTDAVTFLQTWIAANPNVYYSYLVPREWDANATFLSLIALFKTTTSKTYFFVTTTTGTYSNYTGVKCVVALVEAPSIPTSEFSLATAFQVALGYAPSSTNKVTPFAFSFLFGVTAYPTSGNGALLTSLKTAHINYVGSGAEGGVSDTLIFWGTTGDGNDFTYWYSVDWVQINIDLNITNAVFNGSNNPANPLYYNQAGINRLQQVAINTMTTGVSFGLVLGQVTQTALDPYTFTTNLDDGDYDGVTVVNAVSFLVYSKLNPGDYALGKYTGFTIVYTPSRGFTAITFNVVVTQFVAA